MRVATKQLGARSSGRVARSSAARLAVGPLIGLVIGAATSFAQSELDGTWQALSNSASPWLLGAFVAGAVALTRGRAAGAGLGACVVEVVAYYVVTSVRGYPASHTEIVFWCVCAAIGGPVFGWAGWAWRRGDPTLRPVGGALIPATFIAEAIGTYQLRLHYHGDVVLYSLVGLVLLVVLVTTTRRPLHAVAATVVFAVIGIGVYWLALDAVAGAAFGA